MKSASIKKLVRLVLLLRVILNETRNRFTNLSIQSLLYSKSFPNWPDTEVYAITDTLFESYRQYNQ